MTLRGVVLSVEFGSAIAAVLAWIALSRLDRNSSGDALPISLLLAAALSTTLAVFTPFLFIHVHVGGDGTHMLGTLPITLFGAPFLMALISAGGWNYVVPSARRARAARLAFGKPDTESLPELAAENSEITTPRLDSPVPSARKPKAFGKRQGR